MKKLFILLLMTLCLVAYGEKYALIIGIKYDMGDSSLPECVNDAKAMHKLLSEKYNFPKNNIDLILSEKATEKNLRKAFNQLAGKVKSGDTVVVFYSGHGSQADDDEDNPDETDDELDEVIVTYDEEYIRDDDLGKWFDQMTKRGAQVVVMLDSCYSGTGIKAFEIPTNKAKKYFAKKYISGKKRGWITKNMNLSSRQKKEARRVILKNNKTSRPENKNQNITKTEAKQNKSLVFYSGCAENEVSWTLPQKSMSNFTYHFLQAYENNLQGDKNRDGKITFEEAYEYVRVNAKKAPTPQPQNPTFEGNYQRTSINQLYPNLFEGKRKPEYPFPNRTLKFSELIDQLILYTLCVPAYRKAKVDVSLSGSSTGCKDSFYFGDYLTLKVTPNRAGYLIVLNVSEQGEVRLMFPNKETQDNKVKKGKTITIPPPYANWGIQIQPPAAREWMIAYLFENNPLDGVNIPDTFRGNYLLQGNVQNTGLKISAATKKQLVEELVKMLAKAELVRRPRVIEKWTKSVITYKVQAKE